MPIRAIVFDLDDTLLPSKIAYAQALHATLGADLSAYERARQQVKSLLPEGSTASHNRLLYFKCMLELMGKFSSRTNLELLERYESNLITTFQEHLAKIRWLDRLRVLRKTYRLAILTNENLRTQLKKIDLLDPRGDLFDWILTSEEVGVEKPNEAMFLQITQKLGVSFSESCYVGDSLRADIFPALQLGFAKVFHTTEFAECAELTPAPAIRIQNLSEALDIL